MAVRQRSAGGVLHAIDRELVCMQAHHAGVVVQRGDGVGDAPLDADHCRIQLRVDQRVADVDAAVGGEALGRAGEGEGLAPPQTHTGRAPPAFETLGARVAHGSLSRCVGRTARG